MCQTTPRLSAAERKDSILDAALVEFADHGYEGTSTEPGDRHGWQAYVIQVDRRDEVMAGLRAQGIQCQIGTYALHRLGAYRDQGPFPGADAAFERALALPLHQRLTEGELDRVAEALDKLVSHH
jgi:perosamine synthetase